MKFFLQILLIVRKEARYLRGFPKKLLSAATLAFVPAVYCLLYITSVWDPETKTNALPVAVVNLDDGVKYREHAFNVGWEITTRLEDSGSFGFTMSTDEPKARELVRQGKLAFAVIIPHDFSANAVPGAESGAGKVVIYTSQGNNFETAAIAKRFAETLGRAINESLNERRWALVLHEAAGSQQNIERLHDAVDKLRAGARDLKTGSKQSGQDTKTLALGARRLNDGVSQMTDGAKQLGNNLRAMDAKQPGNANLTALTSRARALASGQKEMTRTMDELQKGTIRLREHATESHDEVKDRLFGSGNAPEILEKFADNMTQLDDDIKTASATQTQLATRAIQLRNGVNTLAGSMRGVITRFPNDNQLDDLARDASDVAGNAKTLLTGSQKTQQAIDRMSSGIDLLAKTLPHTVNNLSGNAAGLANSVEPVLEIDAPVENSGSGFASNIVPGALWLGAAVAIFLIHVPVLPREAQFFSPTAKVVGKIFMPACIALLQSLMVLVAVQWVLHIHVAHPWAFALTLSLSSLTFLLIIFALVKTFGDAGKGIAMFLLAIQLSSSGGILPVELSGGLFAQISPWLPITWVVESLKSSMFGAYNGAWQGPLVYVGYAGLAGLVVSCSIGRWRFVSSPARHRRIEMPSAG